MNRAGLFKTIAILAVLSVAPFFMGNRYNQHIFNMILIYVILGMSLNLCFGYTGLLSLGHAAFFGLGAYASALASARLGLPFPVCFVLAGFAGLVFGVAIGLPTLRLTGAYFAMATIAFNKVVEVVLYNWDEVTGGPTGIADIQPVGLFGFQLDSEFRYYYLLMPATIVLYIIYRNLIHSHFGKTVLAMRDNAIAAQAMGVNITFLRVAIFSFSTILAALAGSLYAHMVGYVSPDAFPVMESITLLILVVVGGPGFKNGPVYGAFVLVLAGEYLQVLERYNMLIYGFVLMSLLIIMPSGIAGVIEAVKFRFFNRRGEGCYICEVGIEEIR